MPTTTPQTPETPPVPIIGSGNTPNMDFNLSESGINGTGTGTYSSTGGMAQGDSGMSQAQQGLLTSQLGKAYGDDTGELMAGVGSAADGLLKDSAHSGDSGLDEALSQSNQNAVGEQASQIQNYLSVTAPLRQASYEQDAAADLAKVSKLDMNDYMLYNQQQLQQLQLQQTQTAQQMQYVGQIVGAIGAFGGTIAKAVGG